MHEEPLPALDAATVACLAERRGRALRHRRPHRCASHLLHMGSRRSMKESGDEFACLCIRGALQTRESRRCPTCSASCGDAGADVRLVDALEQLANHVEIVPCRLSALLITTMDIGGLREDQLLRAPLTQGAMRDGKLGAVDSVMEVLAS